MSRELKAADIASGGPPFEKLLASAVLFVSALKTTPSGREPAGVMELNHGPDKYLPMHCPRRANCLGAPPLHHDATP